MSCLRGRKNDPAVTPEALQRHKEIEKEIEEAARRKKKEGAFKLLLLGPSESGKSTILKQFKLIYDRDYTTEERKRYTEVIRSNVIDSLSTLAQGLFDLNVAIGSPENEIHADRIKKFFNDNMAFTKSFSDPVIRQFLYSGETPPQIIESAIKLSRDTGILECLRRGNELQLYDSANYFVAKVEKIFASDYVPSDQDILQSRIITTKVTEHRVSIKGNHFKIYDVGGHRAARKRWVPYFDDVTAIIYVAAISAYDQVLTENRSVNRLVDAFALFEQVVNHESLSKIPVILFLNKIDLLQQRLTVSPVKNYFKDYKGDNTYDDVRKWCSKKFLALNHTKERKMYVHYTFATDTNQIKAVLRAVNDIILSMHLKVTGVM